MPGDARSPWPAEGGTEQEGTVRQRQSHHGGAHSLEELPRAPSPGLDRQQPPGRPPRCHLLAQRWLPRAPAGLCPCVGAAAPTLGGTGAAPAPCVHSGKIHGATPRASRLPPTCRATHHSPGSPSWVLLSPCPVPAVTVPVPSALLLLPVHPSLHPPAFPHRCNCSLPPVYSPGVRARVKYSLWHQERLRGRRSRWDLTPRSLPVTFPFHRHPSNSGGPRAPAKPPPRVGEERVKSRRQSGVCRKFGAAPAASELIRADSSPLVMRTLRAGTAGAPRSKLSNWWLRGRFLSAQTALLSPFSFGVF